eukprot:7529087-Prorocentrum_lima.AAC.1
MKVDRGSTTPQGSGSRDILQWNWWSRSTGGVATIPNSRRIRWLTCSNPDTRKDDLGSEVT